MRRLPVERLSRLIEEHQFDLYNDPMPTMAALEGYIDDTSSVLFSLAARIAGWQSDEIDHLARHAGPRPGHRAGDGSIAVGCIAASIVRAAAIAGAATAAGCEEVFAGKQTPKLRAALDQLVG